MENIKENIKAFTKDIGLPGVRKNYEILIDEFKNKENDYLGFLYKLIELEYY